MESKNHSHGIESMDEFDHDTVRDKLANYVHAYIESSYSPSDASVKTEVGVGAAGKRGKSHPDVLLESDLDTWQGCAFDVKVKERSETHLRAIEQFSNYRAAGYQPVLVAPGWFFINDDLNGNNSSLTFQNILWKTKTPIVEIVSSNPLRFSTYYDSWSLDAPGLNEFLSMTTLDRNEGDFTD